MRCECSPLKELDGIKGGDHRAVKMNSDMQQMARDTYSQTIKRRDWGKASTEAMVKIIKTEMDAAIAETVSRERAQKRGEDAEAISANRQIPLSRALAAWETAWTRIKSEIAPLKTIKIKKKKRKEPEWMNKGIREQTVCRRKWRRQ